MRDFINTLEEISKEIEISVSTIMGYVYEYIKDGNTVDFNFDYSMYYNPEYDEEIKKAISDVGYDKVSLIIKKVSDNIKFENIRAYILKYIVKV
ncbi:MAG: helix-turn-helix domain-containing protein [Clostridium sp.]|nr:helix-turn-helix domain-containing protein [Clostridium sp.]